jgi:hypothetical protein
LGAATLGLRALAQRHREQQATYPIAAAAAAATSADHHPSPTRLPLRDLSSDRPLLASLLDAASFAHAAYRTGDANALCAVCPITLGGLRSVEPAASHLRPAFFIGVDHPRGRVVLSVRGSKALADVLTSLTGAPVPLLLSAGLPGGGRVHAGMLAAAKTLQRDTEPLLRELARRHPSYDLLITGHSLGGSVAALLSHLLFKAEDDKGGGSSSSLPPFSGFQRVSCVAVAPAAVASASLADALAPGVTSLVLGSDVVPRFSLANVVRLRREVDATRWEEDLAAAARGATEAVAAPVQRAWSALGVEVEAALARAATVLPASSLPASLPALLQSLQPGGDPAAAVAAAARLRRWLSQAASADPLASLASAAPWLSALGRRRQRGGGDDQSEATATAAAEATAAAAAGAYEPTVPLYPPGRVLHLVRTGAAGGGGAEASAASASARASVSAPTAPRWRLVEPVNPAGAREDCIVLDARLFSDHTVRSYRRALEELLVACG